MRCAFVGSNQEFGSFVSIEWLQKTFKNCVFLSFSSCRRTELRNQEVNKRSCLNNSEFACWCFVYFPVFEFVHVPLDWDIIMIMIWLWLWCGYTTKGLFSRFCLFWLFDPLMWQNSLVEMFFFSCWFTLSQVFLLRLSDPFLCCILTFNPAKNAIPKWCTGTKWHIPVAVMRRNRVGGLGWQYGTR